MCMAHVGCNSHYSVKFMTHVPIIFSVCHLCSLCFGGSGTQSIKKAVIEHLNVRVLLTINNEQKPIFQQKPLSVGESYFLKSVIVKRKGGLDKKGEGRMHREGKERGGRESLFNK